MHPAGETAPVSERALGWEHPRLSKEFLELLLFSVGRMVRRQQGLALARLRSAGQQGDYPGTVGSVTGVDGLERIATPIVQVAEPRQHRRVDDSALLLN